MKTTSNSFMGMLKLVDKLKFMKIETPQILMIQMYS